ncbi:MAG: hypothetical protein GKR93_12215 [Gammaproteobacteria bacterium]|nr:hypothetical protein [Gammaproteobacteria bacterium]
MISYKLSKCIGLILFALSCSAGQQVIADSQIRVHRANQYHQLKNRLDKRPESTPAYYHHRNQLYKKKRRARAIPVPDSRFPNSYRAYDYYQRSQTQRRGDR